MNSAKIIANKYKPYRYTINKTTTLIDSSLGKFVIKKQQKDVLTLFNYLDSRGFKNHPHIDYNYQNIENIYDYVKDSYLPKEQKLVEMATIIASLHNKTVYFKKITIDNIKEIYDLILENINYMYISFEAMFLNICKKEFQSPSEYLFARNYYKLISSLEYAKDKLNDWFNNVNNDKFRVSIIHNNLKLEHFIYNSDLSILISWDNYRIDSPIIDITNLYKNEYDSMDFSEFFKVYFNHFELLDDEKELLWVIMAIPFVIEDSQDGEIIKTQKIQKLIEYVKNTEDLIRTYDTKKKKE